MSRRSPKRKKTLVKKPKIGKRVVKSDFEFQVWKALKNVVPRGADIEYESEKLVYTIASEYTPDFVVTCRDGRKIYIEAKGNGRAFDHSVRQKMIAVKEQHPELDIRLLFYSDGKIGNTRKDGTWMKQSDWAQKNGFVFAIRELPKDWFNG